MPYNEFFSTLLLNYYLKVYNCKAFALIMASQKKLK